MAQVETARSRVELDGKQAAEQLKTLGARADELKAKLTDLQKANDLAGFKKAEKELKGVEAEMRAVRKATMDVDTVLKNLSGATLNQVNSAYTRQRNVMKNMARDAKDYGQELEKLRRLERERSAAMAEMSTQIGTNHSMLSKATNAFNKYAAVAAAFVATITGLSFTFRKLSQDVAEMDDIFADVMKTTGMTRDEVVDLNEEFKKMDTRTSREQLNMLARDAGKLGKTGKKDILDFVEAGNQINVALGEDLGEDAIKNIGKMVDVFKQSQADLQALDLKGQMLAVGSAINELGQSSTASEPYLVSFTGRLGGVAAQAKISIQDILGYASALDQNMQPVEMSATALSKFIMALYSEPAKFAKLAGKDVKEFTTLLGTDANAAIKQVLTSMNEKGGFQQLVPVFQEMGLDGARAVGVLSSLANNIEKVNEAQEVANQAFTEGTSLTNEYSIKNNNLKAQLEKARKEFKEAALDLGERLNPALLKSTKLSTYLVKVLPGILDWFKKWSGVLITATATITAYTVAVKLQTLWQNNFGKASVWSTAVTKAKMLAETGAIAASQLYAAATMLLTGNIAGATQAMRIFNNTLKSSPIGLIASLVVGVGVAIWQYNSRTKEAVAETKKLSNVMADAAKSVDGERAQVEMLLAVAKDEKQSKEDRIRAIQKLNEISPEYLGGLTLENINSKEAAASMKAYTDELVRNAQAKAIQEELTKLFAEKLKVEKDIINQQILLEERKKSIAQIQDFGGADKMASIAETTSKVVKESLEAEKKQIEGQINILLDLQKTALKKPEDAPAGGGGNTPAAPNTDKEYEKRKLKLAQERAQGVKDAAAYEQELYNLEVEYLKKKISAEAEGSDERIKLEQKLADLQIKQRAKQEQENQRILTERDKHFAALQKISDDYAKSQADKDAAEILAIEQKYDRALEAEEKAHENGLISANDYLLRKGEIESMRQGEIDAKKAEQRKKAEEREKKAKDKFDKERLEARKRYEVMGLRELYEEELRIAKDLHDKKLLSDEEYQKAKAKIDKKYKRAQKKADQKAIDEFCSAVREELATVQAATTVAGDFVTALQDSEIAERNTKREEDLAALTENYNAQMAAAEGNAEEQERIKQEYEDQKAQIDYQAAKDNLDTQKKYADANFAIQATQAVITGVISAMQAFSAMAGIPIVGPILGAAAAAAVGVTTALQIKSLNAERERIKSVTLEAPTSSSGKSSSSTPKPEIPPITRTVQAEDLSNSNVVKARAKGKYDVISADDDREYNNVPLVKSATGVITRPTLVAEEPELVVSVADFPHLRKHVNYPLVLSAINDARDRRTVPARAQGDYSNMTTATPGTTDSGMAALLQRVGLTMEEVRKLLAYLKENGVEATTFYVATEAEKEQKRLEVARKNAQQ